MWGSIGNIESSGEYYKVLWKKNCLKLKCMWIKDRKGWKVIFWRPQNRVLAVLTPATASFTPSWHRALPCPYRDTPSFAVFILACAVLTPGVPYCTILTPCCYQPLLGLYSYRAHTVLPCRYWHCPCCTILAPWFITPNLGPPCSIFWPKMAWFVPRLNTV